MSECASKGCGCTTEPIIQPTAPAPLATGSAQAVYRIENMDCPTEETLIRNKLGTVAGVADLDFNLMQRTLSVRHANQVLPDVLVALQALGFEAQVVDTAEVASPSAAPVTTPTNWWPLGISLVTASAAEAVYWLHNGNHWSVVVLALVAVFTGGFLIEK